MDPLVDPAIESYAAEHSSRPSKLLEELEQYTYDNLAEPQMIIGRLEAGLLQMLVRLLRARRVLEIGLFSGYSALAMAEALDEHGEIVSCEIDEKHAEVARSFFRRSPVGYKIGIWMGPAMESLERIEGPFDLVFLDADKENYPAYYERVMPMLRQGGLIVADNVLWSGRVLDPEKESDHALVTFNKRVQEDPAVENVLLPVRDGVMVARKR
ncbi:MAG TPA: class I SAM-dependent methyltransferase [Arenicellales bacterium]|nr:class I SAM-dependent methyltransferase [Arenicellales bacterium]